MKSVRRLAPRDEACAATSGPRAPAPVAALYQCRLLALTLPTTTLLLQHDAGRRRRPSGARRCARRCPTPVRHTTPPAATRLDRVGDDLPDTGALDDHVRLEAHVRDGAGVVGRAEGANELRLGPRFDPVEDVDLEPVLPGDEGGKQADRSGAGHEHGPRLPEGTLADRGDLLPRLGDDRRGLEQHAEQARATGRPSWRTRARSASART